MVGIGVAITVKGGVAMMIVALSIRNAVLGRCGCAPGVRAWNNAVGLPVVGIAGRDGSVIGVGGWLL